MKLIRTGECNLCGQCCGGNQARNPFREMNFDYVADFNLGNVIKSCPPMALIKADQDVDLAVGSIASHGKVTLNGQDRYWIRLAGEGLCTDLPPYGDAKGHSAACPLLITDRGDGTFPCALVGSEHEDIWHKHCTEGSIGFGFPKYEMPQAEVDVWFTEHPKCSFIYKVNKNGE